MKRLANITTYLAAGLQLVFGLVYIFRNEFMPYHAEAAGLAWNEVSQSFQFLFIAGMKIAGVGFIMSSLVISYLQYQYNRQNIQWIPGLILFIGAMSFIGSISAILIVKINTPGNPPFGLASIGWLLILGGFFFNKKATSKSA